MVFPTIHAYQLCFLFFDREVQFYGKDPVTEDEWKEMAQDRKQISKMRSLFVSCDKQSRTGDLVLQIPYFVAGEIVNVGTFQFH